MARWRRLGKRLTGVTTPFGGVSWEAVPDASRDLAECISAAVQWPDEEVRAIDHLHGDERWWVLYLNNSGPKPVFDVSASLYGGGRQVDIDFPPLEPGRRRWYILRPESGFPPDSPPPSVSLAFRALDRDWRLEDGVLAPSKAPRRHRMTESE